MQPSSPRREHPTLPTVPERGRPSLAPAPDPDAAWLVVIHGEELGRRIALSADGTVIGRASGCTVQVEHDAISRAHVAVRRRGGAWHISDLGSKNGTFVNDVRLTTEALLREGDVVLIGAMTFKFISGATAEGQYFETIHRLTTTDGLTELSNRRHFDALLARELNRALHYERVFSLIVMDVDHFKHINDDLGDSGGGMVLRQLGQLLRTSVRTQDVAARLGGEELGVLLPETPSGGVRALAERLRTSVESHSFVFADQRVPVTVSVGACTWTPAVRTVDALLAQADALLYRAKHAGRNRVVTDTT